MAYTTHTRVSPRASALPQASVERQPFHKSHSTLGATGHWIRTAGILAPLVIGEFVKDPEQRWRYIRLAAVGTALVSEGLWSNKIHHERQEARERERACLEMA